MATKRMVLMNNNMRKALIETKRKQITEMEAEIKKLQADCPHVECEMKFLVKPYDHRLGYVCSVCGDVVGTVGND